MTLQVKKIKSCCGWERCCSRILPLSGSRSADPPSILQRIDPEYSRNFPVVPGCSDSGVPPRDDRRCAQGHQ